MCYNFSLIYIALDVIQFQPNFHGYDAAWFVSGVTTQVSVVTREPDESRVLLALECYVFPVI